MPRKSLKEILPILLELKSAIDPEVNGIVHLASRKTVNDANPRQQFVENSAITCSILEPVWTRYGRTGTLLNGVSPTTYRSDDAEDR
jgi:hypothetical protein